MTCFPRPPFSDFPDDDAEFGPATPEGLAALVVPVEDLDIESPSQQTWNLAVGALNRAEFALDALDRREARLVIRERNFWISATLWGAMLVVLTCLLVSAGNRVLPQPTGTAEWSALTQGASR